MVTVICVLVGAFAGAFIAPALCRPGDPTAAAVVGIVIGAAFAYLIAEGHLLSALAVAVLATSGALLVC